MSFIADDFPPLDPSLAIVRNPLVANPTTPLKTILAQMQTGLDGQDMDNLQQCSLDISDPHRSPASQGNCVIAVDHGQVVGILTLRDILRLLYHQHPTFLHSLRADHLAISLGEVMTQPVVTLAEAAFTDLSIAADLLRHHRIRHLPLLNEDQTLAGLVTWETVQHTLLVNQLRWSDYQRRTIAKIERRYANLVNTVPVGIFHTDAQGRYTYVNERWCQITGLQPENALHQPWDQIILDEDLPLVEAEIAATTHQDCPFRCEFRLKQHDNRIVWVCGQMVAEWSAQGTWLGYLGTLTDVTESKQFEAALQKSDADNRNILSLIPDYLFRIDHQGKYRDIVTYQRDISLVKCGVNPVGHTMAEVLPPQVARWQMEYLHRALMQGDLGVYEQQVDMGDHGRWEEVRVIKSGHDEALFMVRDISDRKHTENALQALIESTATVTGQDFFSSLVSHIAAALRVDYALVTELQGKELQTLAFWANNQLRSVYRYPFAGTPCEHSLRDGIFYCESNLQQYFPADLDLASMEVESYLGVKLQNAGGEPIGVLCILHHSPLANPEQAKNLLRVFAARAAAELERQRITLSLQNLNQQLETKVLERTEALRTTNAELARATRLKDEFLANMSHELRTPLNAILGLAEALQEGVFGDLNETQTKTLATIETSGQHLLALINDILDVAKIEAGKMELQPEIVDLAELCHSSCKFVFRQAVKKHIQIDTQLTPELPPLAIDERRMRQVLINLLSNAVKFTPPEGRITISTRYCPAKPPRAQVQFPQAATPKVHITVADTGIGIAPEKLERLFQPFVQIDSALNRRYKGTGLGLALVKRIVELHGGQVFVFSQPGAGSRFTLELPCPEAKQPSRAEGKGGHASKHGPNQTSATPALVLIVEDNEANMATISGYLKARDYSIGQAVDGQQAIDQALKETPDVILMDIQMPGMDGLEAIRKIRRIPQLASVPIVAITALAQPDDRQRCLDAGANRYLPKPLKLKQLAITIQELLAASSSSSSVCASSEDSIGRF